MARTILLADDSMTIQKVVELTFVGQDYQVTAVSDGDAALERFAQGPTDLVIADVHMPGADGYEVCRRIKATHADTPVLLLVGTFEDFDEAKAQEVGADANLKKPFDSQELLGKVEELLARGAAPDAPASDAPAPPVLVPDVATVPAPAPDVTAPPATVPLDSATVPTPPEASPPELVIPDAAVPAEADPSPTGGPLSDADVDRIARRVVELLGGDTVREVAWEVIPDLAEVIIKERIGELERQVESI